MSAMQAMFLSVTTKSVFLKYFRFILFSESDRRE